MRRIRRVASIILLTLGLFLGSLWIGSAWYFFAFNADGLVLFFEAGDAGILLVDPPWKTWLFTGLNEREFAWFYFAFEGFSYVTFPAWIPAATVILLGVWACWATRPRFPAGTCQACGYNLQGATSDRCSECGAAIEAK